jgi:nucleotide-binding universal stress UspA family protein
MSASNGLILVPLDGTAPPERTLPGSVARARRLGHGLRLVHVINPDAAVDVSAYLEQLQSRTRAQGMACDAVVAVGDPVDAALHEAERSAARYISLARRDVDGRDGLIGSGTFHRLLRDAQVPLLVFGGVGGCPAACSIDL